MAVTIDLPIEIETKLREEATKKGAKFEDYLNDLARHWASANGTSVTPIPPAEEKTTAQRIAEFRAFVASHEHITAIADDSRESIYAGCGE